MNILVFSWRDPKHPSAGGAEQVMHEHMKGWVRAGHSVTLFSSRFKGSVKEEVLDSVRIVRGGHQYIGVQLKGFLYYLREGYKIDLVIDQFHGIPFFTPLYVREAKLAVIQEVARNVWVLNPLIWPLNYLVGVLGLLVEPFIFLLYRRTQFMTGSDSAKRDIIKFGIPNRNITVVPHGVLLDLPNKLPQKESVKTVCYLGVLSKDKGIEDAINCFKLMSKKDKFQFWVIGKPETKEYGNKIKALVRNLELENQIKFWGFVSQKEKFNLLARAHILINPSIHEGWGLVNIEANAVSTPVVAYKSAGLTDSVKEGFSGLLTDENNPEKLTEVILTLFRNPQILHKLQINSKEWSTKFNWANYRRKSLELIEDLKR